MSEVTIDRRKNWTPSRRKAHSEKMKQAWAGKKGEALVVDEQHRSAVEEISSRLEERFGFKPTATQTLNHLVSRAEQILNHERANHESEH